SRAGLLTGRYPTKFRFTLGIFDATGLPFTEKTIAERMKTVGYRTGIVGKWHVGQKDGQKPLERGFDEFYGVYGGGSWYKKRELPKKRGGLDQIVYKNNKADVWDENEYLTDAFGRESAEFIDRNKDKPFFLYSAFNAVHSPMEATEKYLGRFRDKI